LCRGRWSRIIEAVATVAGDSVGETARWEVGTTNACLLCDDPAVAAALLAPVALSAGAPDVAAARVVWQAIGGPGEPFVCAFTDDFWRGVCVVREPGASQFDALRALLAAGFRPPGPLFTLAVAGRGFHGQRARTWAAVPGNLHLCAALCPADLPAEHVLALTMLPAVAAVDAIAGVGGGAVSAGIKWVNDIVLEGRKVGGVLTAAQTLDGRVGWAVLGIGLNVAVAPDVPPTPFVPAVGCLASYRSDLTLREVLAALLRALAQRCRELEREGPATLLAAYRAASVIIGREICVWPEEADGAATTGRPRARGVVQAINGDLSLTLADEPEPVRSGRLVIEA
jgi:biotin-[acetyl-CoA-carboxylase] ligase BirA-like protein